LVVENERTIELLDELVAWTRFANMERLTNVLQRALADTRHLIAYEASDGTRSQGEVARRAGISQPTVSGLWARWRRIGIVREHDGRVRHLIRPSDIGLIDDAPPSPSRSHQT
jgi:hypothetical protein